MPATSKSQRIAAAIAEHHPSQLYARNKAMLGMSQGQLHEFAATKEKKLPMYVKSRRLHHSPDVVTGACDPNADNQFATDHGVYSMSRQQIRQWTADEDEPRRRHITGYQRKWIPAPPRGPGDV